MANLLDQAREKEAANDEQEKKLQLLEKMTS